MATAAIITVREEEEEEEGRRGKWRGWGLKG